MTTIKKYYKISRQLMCHVSYAIVAILLMHNYSYCQTRNVNIDSIKQLVNVTEHDSVSINNLLYLTYLQTFRYPEDALEYTMMVREFAPSIPFEEAWLKSYYMAAKVYTGLGQYDKAKEELDFLASQNSLKLFPEIQCDCQKALGHYYRGINQFDKAIEEYNKSIAIGEKTGDFDCHRGPMISIGGTHDVLQNYDLAIEYYDLALKSLATTYCYHITSEVFYAKADLLEDIKDKRIQLDSSMYYAVKAVGSLMIFRAQWKLGRLENDQKNAEIATKKFDQAARLITGFGPNVEIALFLIESAVFNHEVGRKTLATENYIDALAIIGDNSGARVEAASSSA